MNRNREVDFVLQAPRQGAEQINNWPYMMAGGRWNVNPMGSCFDSSANFFVGGGARKMKNAVMCHGIGISNCPSELGHPIAHAWIEFDHEMCGRAALDCIWMVAVPADKYRKDLQISYVREYKMLKFMFLWLMHHYAGPFDKKILALTKD